MAQKNRSGLLGRLTALVLFAVLLVSATVLPTRAADRDLSMQQAVNMAVQSSSELTAQKNKILLKRMKYVEAVKGIRAKVKNLRTFRWSPLLSFKFPQPLDITMEFDMNFKPTILQADIDKLTHQMEDIRRGVVEKTETWFLTAYQLQSSVAFTQANLEDAKEQQKRIQVQLGKGEATDTDAARAATRVTTLETKLGNQLRDFEKAKEKLTDLIGVDVTTGYNFRNPFRVANIPREQLDTLVQETLAKDHQFFEMRTNESVAKLKLDGYESLMRNQYGWKMYPIDNFINMSRQGMEVDSAAFQMAYNRMLGMLDEPWYGSFRIIFFRFAKELLKGPISGTRYIENEMYAVYTACSEYTAAIKERESLEKELTTQVRDTFENVVTSYNAYTALEKTVDRNREELDQLLILNKMGKATYEEVSDAQQAYQDSQQDTLDALFEYNKLLTEYDRLTCGAVSGYLNGAALELDSGSGGDAYAILDPIKEPYYYIYNSVADLTFNIGVSVPEDHGVKVDEFEIWYEGTQLGRRTPIKEELRHLVLDYGDSNKLTIRLYGGGKFVDECEIDTTVPRDRLDIQWGPPPQPAPKVLGSYKLRTLMGEKVPMTELTLQPNADLKITGYRLTYGEGSLLTAEQQEIGQSFSYLSLMLPAFSDMEVLLYTEDGQELKAYFDTENLQLLDMKPAAET